MSSTQLLLKESSGHCMACFLSFWEAAAAAAPGSGVRPDFLAHISKLSLGRQFASPVSGPLGLMMPGMQPCLVPCFATAHPASAIPPLLWGWVEVVARAVSDPVVPQKEAWHL